MATPGLPVAWAYPSAACPAPCSWRTRIWRSEESIMGSYTGRIAPPGSPKTTSVPQVSNERIRACAPVSFIFAIPCSCWVYCLDLLMIYRVLVSCTFTCDLRKRKSPPGGRLQARRRRSCVLLGYYERRNNSDHRQPLWHTLPVTCKWTETYWVTAPFSAPWTSLANLASTPLV